MFKRRGKAHQHAGGPPQSGDFNTLLTETAARIGELIEAADRTAVSVRQKAELSASGAEGDRRERIVRELALGLVDRVDAMREEAHDLRRVLERANRVFSQSEVARRRQVETAAERSPQTPAPGAERSSPLPSRGAAAAEPSQGVILLATQMAVAGSGRDEIASRLKEDFGVADTDAVLDRALGSVR